MQLFLLSTKNNKYPLALSLISFIFGIYWQNKFECNVIFIALALILLPSFLLQKKYYNTKVIYFFFFFSGALLLQNQKNNHTSTLKELENKRLDLIAKIINQEKSPQNNYKETLIIQVEKIKPVWQQNFYAKNFNLSIYLRIPSDVEVGDVIEIKSINIKRPVPKKILTNNPSFNEYLLKEDVLATVFTNNLNYTKIYTPKFSIKKWLLEKKQKIFNEIKIKLSPKTFTYFSYIFLGNKKDKTVSGMRKQFNNWGISHYLARSGLHIILFILIWKFLLGLIPIKLNSKHIMLLLICISYQLLSWSSISFSRAFYVFIIYELGRLLNKQTNFMHILSLVCLFILITNPIQLFFVDFQLSFALTFALAIFGQTTKMYTFKQKLNPI